MYYYAYIDADTGFCHHVIESEEPMSNPLYIELSGFSSYLEYDKYYPVRKTYENGIWRDTTVEEAEAMFAVVVGERATINGEWLNVVLDNKASINHEHNDYAMTDHTHTGYALTDDLTLLGDIVNTKADATHTHDEYADVNHLHSNYSLTTHAHTAAEVGAATSGHNHDSDYASINHNHNGVYATSGHDHDTDYSPIGHGHTNYATTTSLDEVSATVNTKANTSDLNSHVNNTNIHITSTERTNWNASKTHADSAHAPSNAEENQNAFSNVVVGSTTISADTKTDILTLIAGNNITITPDSTSDSITISSANTVYTHPTSSGNKHIPAGGSSGQILRWSADGTAVWGE